MNDEELRREYQRSSSTTPLGPHPEPEQLAELVNGVLPESQRLELLEHVMRCPTCGPELDLLRAANEGVRAAEHRVSPSRWMAFAAAALIVIGIGTLTIRGHRLDVPVDVMRGQHEAMSLIEPAAGSTVSAPVRLAWHPMEGAQGYRVELLTTRGDMISAWSTLDTTFAIPDSVRIRANESYDVWVRVMLADRTEISSSMVRFSVK